MTVTTATPAPVRRRSGRRVRDMQRAAHLAVGTALLVELYFGSVIGDGFGAVVRWVLAPAAVLTGIAMWKWARIRRLLRR
jgi:hypothetical protein